MTSVIARLVEDLEELTYPEQMAYLAHVKNDGLEAGFSPLYVSLCAELYDNGWEDSENPAMKGKAITGWNGRRVTVDMYAAMLVSLVDKDRESDGGWRTIKSWNDLEAHTDASEYLMCADDALEVDTAMNDDFVNAAIIKAEEVLFRGGV